ncbi:hypothetical protein Micbo1qcDRAFT_179324 [Microdochium bolleyi]|uniref:F-box domain-containing protein n=1 Tax=Microdochium bolleyi TaxID=196109 RepID=A0A136IQ70_9PEZI|nr:hypothetical protein Micbo1qcDRAFT_179324 [Microdochium bolleyi]
MTPSLPGHARAWDRKSAGFIVILCTQSFPFVGMDSFPQEILDTIALHLRDDKPACLALVTVSHKWQVTTERLVFRELNVKSTELDLFKSYVHDNPHRRASVRTIDFFVVLPAYSDVERRLFEDEDDRQINNEAFSTAVHNLFALLQHWGVATAGEGVGGSTGALMMVLMDMYSSSDHSFLIRSSKDCDINLSRAVRRSGDLLDPAMRQYQNGVRSDPIVDLHSWRYMYSHVKLLRASELPLVPAIGVFSKVATNRHVSDHSLVLMAASMPNLRRVTWRFNSWDIRYLTLWREERHLLTEAITEHLHKLRKLESVAILMSGTHIWPSRFFQGDLNPVRDATTSDSGNYDLLSDACRRALSTLPLLRRLWILGHFDAALFSPPQVDRRQALDGCWPSLERLEVGLESRKPGGGGYFLMTGKSAADQSFATATESPPGHHRRPGHGEQQPSQAQRDEYQALRESEVDNLDRETHMPWPQPFRDGVVIADHDGALSGMLASFARACASCSMPRLQQASMIVRIPASTPSNDDLDRPVKHRCDWGVWYASAGVVPCSRETWRFRDQTFYEDAHRRRLLWDTQDWYPSEDLQEIFSRVGTADDQYDILLVVLLDGHQHHGNDNEEGSEYVLTLQYH